MRRSALMAVLALACSCIVEKPKDALNRAHAIAIGNVTDVSSQGVDGGEVQTATVDVEYDLKENLPDSILVEQDQRSSCSSQLSVGDRFSALVYPSPEGDAWATDNCSQIDERAMFRLTGASPPASVAPPPSPVSDDAGPTVGLAWVPVGSFLLMGVGVGLWLAMRGSRKR